MQGPDKIAAPRRGGPGAPRGLTIVELMVVIAIAALLASMTLIGFGSIASARLKSAAALIASAAQRAFSYATARGENVRLTLDLDGGTLLLEAAGGRVVLDKNALGQEEQAAEEEKEAAEKEKEKGKEKGPAAGGGAAVKTGEAVEEGKGGKGKGFDLGASTLADRIKAGFHEGEVPKYKPPVFSPIKGKQFAERPLPPGVKLLAVYSQLFEGEKRGGKAYIYFFPEGTADHTAVQLQGSGGQIYTVEVLSASARTKVYDYPYVPEFEADEDEE